MSIATEKELAASDRYLLVRLTPGKYINDDLSVISGSIYGATLTTAINSNVAKIERNGTELTEVSTITGNDEYTYDEDTGELRIQLASAPDEDTNVIILFFHLFYTGTKNRYVQEDPTGTGPVRDWEPKLKRYPSLRTSYKNIIQGVLTVEDTNFELINLDHEIETYLDENTSFYQKDCNVWVGINDVTPELAYTGRMSSPSIGNDSVRISVFDVFNRLRDPATMGDAQDEIYYNDDLTFATATNPNDLNKPIKYVPGKATFREDDDRVINVSGGAGEIDTVVGNWLDGEQALSISYEPEPTSLIKTKNRDWGMARVSSSGVATQSIGSITSQEADTTVTRRRRNFDLASHDLEIGETIKYTVASVDYYARVTYNQSFTVGSGTWNLSTIDESTSQPTPTSLTPIKKVAVKWNDASSSAIELTQEVHYTVGETTTSFGNTFVEINLVDSFENDVYGAVRGAVDPKNDTFIYQLSPAGGVKHGDALKAIVDASGLDTDATSFSNANTALDANAFFTIPKRNESDFQPYIKYAEQLLASTLGYMRVGDDGEVEYFLLDATSAGDEIDQKLTLNGEFTTRLNYEDIVTALNPFNAHLTDSAGVSGGSTTQASSNKSRYLHEVNRTETFEHLLEDISGRIDEIVAVRSRRDVRYSFATASENIDSQLGEDITLTNDRILNASKTDNVKIIRLQKSSGKTTVTAREIKGL